MKKIFFYIVCIECMVFAVPYLLTKNFEDLETSTYTSENSESKEVDKTPYNYSKYGTIKLLNSVTNEIAELNIDEYLLRCCICRNAS